ncbi:hypothetical protein AALP_AA7G124200 [Arabis alpina]|uniref:Uncharacterized protein n=1 Tax=Arabis alpina TaxID=50452 RepID=A0A087GHK9_ARAAL|nr:hypothetical protein AALP_AA7G124200 [Arabis alpina]
MWRVTHPHLKVLQVYDVASFVAQEYGFIVYSGGEANVEFWRDYQVLVKDHQWVRSIKVFVVGF